MSGACSMNPRTARDDYPTIARRSMSGWKQTTASRTGWTMTSTTGLTLFDISSMPFVLVGCRFLW